MTIEELVANFNTTPFLFVGSGLTRRYFKLPDWKGLLEHFASIVSDDSFAYRSYENKAHQMDCPVGLMPKIAELIQMDFNRRWYTDSSTRSKDPEVLEAIKNGGDPFKYEVASYICNQSVLQNHYEKEIQLLHEVSKKSISGVITTNYDSFLEDTFVGYKKYVGQKQLIFSAIQGIAEIYKIHGSVENPDSLILNEKDYIAFMEDSSYLAAKLMTIFMEFPIIFIGYSISDSNIQEIIKSIVHCLDEKQLEILGDRFVFVEYVEEYIGYEITPHTVIIGDKMLTMKKIRIADFGQLYEALKNKRSKLPVRLLRRLKEELYDYTITSVPTSRLRVAELEDKRIGDEELVISIGKTSDLGLKGLSGLDGNEWYRDIVLGDISFSADDLLTYAFPKIFRQYASRLPVNKYLKKAKKPYPKAEEVAKKYVFDNIISNTIKNNRKILGDYTSINQIWNQEKDNLEKATRLIAYLPENQIDIDELEKILKILFEEDVNILNKADSPVRTNIRRLILIYDYLKWGK